MMQEVLCYPGECGSYLVTYCMVRKFPRGLCHPELGGTVSSSTGNCKGCLCLWSSFSGRHSFETGVVTADVFPLILAVDTCVCEKCCTEFVR